MDDVNIYIDELTLGSDGRNETLAAEQVLRLFPEPQAQQIAASVEQSITAAIGAATAPGA
jgi:hypothetical protein